MKKSILIALFVLFLIENNALIAFITNLNPKYSDLDRLELPREFVKPAHPTLFWHLKRTIPDQFINYHSIWNQTFEGHGYWSELQHQWRKKLRTYATSHAPVLPKINFIKV